MSSFTNGPAHAVKLMLRRAPKFIRVTEHAGEFDALYQLSDEPQPSESLFAYERIGAPMSYHIRLSGKAKAGSGFYQDAEYAYITKQPDDATMRERERWQQWCRERAAAGNN